MRTLEIRCALNYSTHMRTRLALAILLLGASVGRAQDNAAPSIANFANVTAGRYQVFAQSGYPMARQVNTFMNGMLRQYEKFFNNWTLKPGARVIVFDNPDDFRRYASDAMTLPLTSLAGYCHLKTDEAGNQFYELVSYQDANLWRVLAHEGFHKFIGFELGLQVPTWLNEGMAQYFETSYVTGTHFNVGQISRNKLLQAQRLITNRQAPALEQLIQWDRETFYANANAAYPISWALVYYLLNSNSDRYEQSQFRRYLQDLKFGRDDMGSFQKRFGQYSDHWQADFEYYVLHLKAQTD